MSGDLLLFAKKIYSESLCSVLTFIFPTCVWAGKLYNFGWSICISAKKLCIHVLGLTTPLLCMKIIVCKIVSNHVAHETHHFVTNFIGKLSSLMKMYASHQGSNERTWLQCRCNWTVATPHTNCNFLFPGPDTPQSRNLHPRKWSMAYWKGYWMTCSLLKQQLGNLWTHSWTLWI